ncbi:MAG: hypothetical protein ACQBVK_01890 [Candidatus Phytoplasma sp. TWB_XP]
MIKNMSFFDPGQIEASLALGMTRKQTFKRVICPQRGIGDNCDSLPSFYTRHFEKNKICSRNYFFIIYTIIITYY